MFSLILDLSTLLSLATSSSPVQFLYGSNITQQEQRPHIAIIGSGIGGSSLSFFLHEQLREWLDVDITVFERDEILGGRLRSINLFKVP